jgi:hypothetical protein
MWSRQFFGSLLLASQLVNPSWSQDNGTPPYPSGSNITFQWNYSCTNTRICAFSCPGAGGANNITRLTIYLGTIPVGSNQQSAIFYDFATREVPRGNGFSISGGLSSLACQITGMTLDYSGLPK